MTGVAPLDNLLTPVWGGGLMYLLAPTSTGKTSFLLQMMKKNVLRGMRRPSCTTS